MFVLDVSRSDGVNLLICRTVNYWRWRFTSSHREWGRDMEKMILHRAAVWPNQISSEQFWCRYFWEIGKKYEKQWGRGISFQPRILIKFVTGIRNYCLLSEKGGKKSEYPCTWSWQSTLSFCTLFIIGLKVISFFSSIINLVLVISLFFSHSFSSSCSPTLGSSFPVTTSSYSFCSFSWFSFSSSLSILLLLRILFTCYLHLLTFYSVSLCNYLFIFFPFCSSASSLSSLSPLLSSFTAPTFVYLLPLIPVFILLNLPPFFFYFFISFPSFIIFITFFIILFFTLFISFLYHVFIFFPIILTFFTVF